jgi:hypothetical protein
VMSGRVCGGCCSLSGGLSKRLRVNGDRREPPTASVDDRRGNTIRSSGRKWIEQPTCRQGGRPGEPHKEKTPAAITPTHK